MQLPLADDTVRTRAELRDAPPPLRTMAEIIASMNPSSSPLFTPPLFQPASESLPAQAAEPVQSEDDALVNARVFQDAHQDEQDAEDEEAERRGGRQARRKRSPTHGTVHR